MRMGAGVGLVVLAVVTSGLAVAAVGRGDAAQVEAGSAGPASIVQPSAPASGAPPNMSQVRAAIAARAVTISVLGDSTGNDPGEWVDLWARHLGQNRSVTLHQWDSGAEDWSPDVTRYGHGGDRVTIWNGSQPGARATYPATRIDQIQPVRPDVIIYSFGHNGTGDTIIPELTQTMTAVDSKWGAVPHVVILQNPGRHEHGDVQAATLVALAAWAKRSRTPVVDVASAFRSAPDLASIMKDDAHPNEAGEKVWARAVEKALG